MERAGAESTGLTLRGFLAKYFYFLMSLLITAVVAYGFSFTVDKNLIHPAVPRPRLLYVHAAIFTAWLGYFVLQSGLVRLRKVAWHRTVGLVGVALGALIPILGVWTTFVMGKFDIQVLHSTAPPSVIFIPLLDIACFTSAFIPAVLWRKKPERHRRLMLVASCALTAAGFGRFPERFQPGQFFYAGVDLLIVLGMARDLIVERKVHAVYKVALPAFLLGQALVFYIILKNVPFFARLAQAMVG